jgi:formamidopyrimidine-DNA glycosylase
MPELPEVEVTRRQIAPLLVGRTIAQAALTANSYFFLTRPATLARALRGRRVVALERRGKYLIADLGNGDRLLLHLGMTGQLFSAGAASPRLLVSRGNGIAPALRGGATGKAVLVPEAQAQGFRPDAHTHMRLRFEDGGPEVYFRDTRKFGKVQWLRAGEPSERLDKLGVDALAATGADLYAAARKRGAAIKTVLLDQSVLAGVGNIYADEALFLAGIRPTRPARKLSRADCDRVVAAAQRVMLRSIETGGSSISDYIRPDGTDGGYQDERHVYAREGEACTRCGGKIKRIVLGQRSSAFCPGCQK